MSNDLQRLQNLIAKALDSTYEDEARTCAILAIRLMERSGILDHLQELMKRIKPRRSRHRSHASKLAKSGGKARAKALTPAQRSAIARKAARTRWKRQQLK